MAIDCFPFTSTCVAKMNVCQQLYLNGNLTEDTETIRRIEDSGADALVLTIDSSAGSNRHRAVRFGAGSAYVPPMHPAVVFSGTLVSRIKGLC